MRKFYIYITGGNKVESTFVMAKSISVASGAGNTGQIFFYNENNDICGVAPVGAVVTEEQ